MNRIIVTGATSMIGNALVEDAIKNNIEVLAIIRPNTLNLARLPQSRLLSITECELGHLEDVYFSGDKFDVFYHLGWTGTSKEQRNNSEIQTSNIAYTLNAVRLAKKMGCHTFIGAGSQAEYGRVSDVISPETETNPDSAYGVAKYAAGKMSQILSKEIGLRHIWTRIFSVYGIYDNKNTLIMYTIHELLKGIKPSLSKCEQMWDYLFSEDAGRALRLIGEKGRDQSIYCIGSGIERHLFEYINEIRNQINVELPIGIGERPYEANQVMRLCADISSLQKDTGFKAQIQFQEGIQKTISWFNNNLIVDH